MALDGSPHPIARLRRRIFIGILALGVFPPVAGHAEGPKNMSILDALNLARERNPTFSKASLRYESARLTYLKSMRSLGWVESFTSKADFKRDETGDFKKNIYSDGPTEQITIRQAHTLSTTTSWNYKRVFASGFESDLYSKMASNENKTKYSLTGPPETLTDRSKYSWLTQKINPEVGVNLMVPIMGKDRLEGEHKGRLAEAAWAQAQSDFNQAKKQIVFSVRQGYYDLLKAQAMTDLRKKVLLEAEERFEITRKRLAVGLTTELAVSQAELAVLRNRADLADAAFSEQQALSRFNSLIGLPLDETYELTDSFPFPSSTQTTLKSIQSRVISASDKLKRVDQDVEQASVKVEQAKSKLDPNLSFTSNLAIKSERRTPRQAFKNIEDKYSFGLVYEFPFGEKVVEKADLELAQASLSEKVIQRDEVSQSLVLDATETYQELLKTQQRLAIARQSTEVAKKSLTIAGAKYNEGKAEITDVISAKEALVTAQVEELDNLYSLSVAVASLELLTGESL